MMRPGKGDFPVGQFDAQNLFPNGRGIPSLASSVGSTRVQLGEWNGTACVLALINTGGSKCLTKFLSKCERTGIKHTTVMTF